MPFFHGLLLPRSTDANVLRLEMRVSVVGMEPQSSHWRGRMMPINIKGKVIPYRNSLPPVEYELFGNVDVCTSYFAVETGIDQKQATSEATEADTVSLIGIVKLYGVFAGPRLIFGQTTRGIVLLKQYPRDDDNGVLPLGMDAAIFSDTYLKKGGIFDPLYYHHVCDNLYRRYSGALIIDDQVSPLDDMFVRVQLDQLHGEGTMSLGGGTVCDVSLITLGMVPKNNHLEEPILYYHTRFSLIDRETNKEVVSYEFVDLALGCVYALRSTEQSIKPMLQGTTIQNNIKLFLMCENPNPFFTYAAPSFEAKQQEKKGPVSWLSAVTNAGKAVTAEYEPHFTDVPSSAATAPISGDDQRVVMFTVPVEIAAQKPVLRGEFSEHVWRLFPGAA